MTVPIVTVTLNPGLDRTLTVAALAENCVLRAQESRLDWGGKGFNVSRALRALGVPSLVMGLVGGFTGQMLAQGLRDLGLTTDPVAIAGETRTNTVIQEAGSGRYLKVNEAGPPVTADDLRRLQERIDAHAQPGSHWVFCGSLPPAAPADTYAALVGRVQAYGATAYLDSSGPALAAGLSAVPFLVKPNAEEAAELTGVPVTDLASAQRAAAWCLARGATTVALSLGEQGLLLATAERAVHACPPVVPVQTLVGVGDALLAGLVDAFTRRLPLHEIAAWGVACGTAAAMTPGVGVGDPATVTALAAQVVVTPLTSAGGSLRAP